MNRRFFARLSALLLALTLLLSLSACAASPTAPTPPAEPHTSGGSEAPGGEKPNANGSDTPPTTSEELAQLRRTMAEHGCGIAAACLGWFDGGYAELDAYLRDNGCTAVFPFLSDLPETRFVDGEGGELYLIIPEADDAVRVCDWVIDESNNYSGAQGERTLYQSEDGAPFLLQCNVSDIMPNTVIYTKINKRQPPLVYNPSLSLRDGALSCPDFYEPGYGVLALSAQDGLPVQNRLESADMADLCGMWAGYVLPDDGRSSNSVYLELHEDGTMLYTYSVYDMQTESYAEPALYGGTWEFCLLDDPTLPSSAYVFDLTLEKSPTDGQTPLQTIHTTQYIITDLGGISLQIVAGDDLYPNGWEYPVLLDDASDGVG